MSKKCVFSSKQYTLNQIIEAISKKYLYGSTVILEPTQKPNNKAQGDYYLMKHASGKYYNYILIIKPISALMDIDGNTAPGFHGRLMEK